MRYLSAYYVYIKTNSTHSCFDIGMADQSALQALLTKSQKAVSRTKLVYYEYGHSLASATTRCQRLMTQPLSKYKALIDRHNPAWVDLSIEWLKK